MLSAEILRELREDKAEADKNFSNRYVTQLTLFTLFRISPSLAQYFSIDYMHHLSSFYIQNIIACHLLTVQELVYSYTRTEFTLARVLTITNLYHILCQSMLIN